MPVYRCQTTDGQSQFEGWELMNSQFAIKRGIVGDLNMLWETEGNRPGCVVISTFPSVEYSIRMMETEHTQRQLLRKI